MKRIKHILKQVDPFIRKHHMILLSFFFPIIILEISYAICGIYPFGKRDLLIIDLYHQYAPFLSDLQEKLKFNSGFLYSWAGGLGTSYIPLYAYYAASPLNILTVLFPKEYLTEAVHFLTLLKVGLAGAFFFTYLKGVHNKQGLFTVAFSVFYALSGYVLTFSWNIMWMDCIYLLPLIMLGLVKLVRDSHGLLFCITLSIALFSNFYVAFFVCIFLVLYFPLCYFKYNSIRPFKTLLKKIAMFAGYSLLAAGLAAIILLPTFFALKLTSAADDAFPSKVEHYYDYFDYITRHFTGASPSIREGMPNIYCGIIILILIPIYFLSKNIRLKEKIWHLVLIAILILSFNLNILNFIWHGFHYPNQVPYRFSFVYIFLIISMCYDAFQNLSEFTSKQLAALCVCIFGTILVSQKFDDLSIDYFALYSSLIAIILYGIAFSLDEFKKASHTHSQYSFQELFLFAAIILEIIANTLITTININIEEGYSTREGYSSGIEVAEIRYWISQTKKEDTGFYRMEIVPPKTTNDPYLYNYRGLSIFSSTIPVKTVRMFRNLGYNSNGINSYEYEGSTAILDSIFGIKYLIYRQDNIEENLYKNILTYDEITVYENPYALPLGFLASSDIKKFYSTWSNPFEEQNTLIYDICGVDDILLPIKQEHGMQNNLTFSSHETLYYNFKRPDPNETSTARIKFPVESDQTIYLYFKAPYNMKGSGFVEVNGEKINFNLRHSTIINPGFCKAGSTVELQLTFDKLSPDSGRFEIYSYALDQNAFENAMSLIKENSMVIESFSDTRIKGSIETDSDGIMVMSIPYNNGWHVKIDGRKAETQAVDDCLLSFELPAGFHEIELSFLPDKFLLGAATTLVSILILAVLFFFRKRNKIYINTNEIKQVKQNNI